MKIRDGYLMKNVAGNFVVVPVENLDFDGLLNLNESGALLWKKLESDCTVEQLTKELVDTYGISQSDANRDVDTFLEVLRKENLIHE